MQRNKISFKGQKIFVGIDVHKLTWEVAVLTESGFLKRHSQESSAKVLFDFLRKHYPDGEYHAVYESGFSGFATYYALKEYGIDCVITHAADVPTTQYEEVMKTDKIDAEKLARTLKNNEVKRPVYIREKDNIDDRGVIRIRKTIQKQLSGYKARVKHMLHNNGVELPKRFEKPGTHWSRAFITWLIQDVKLLSSTRLSLDLLIRQVEVIRGTLLEATRELRNLSQTERYKHRFELLLTIPGIGQQVSMCILTEVWDVSRFPNEKAFAHYLGLVPGCHDSGPHKSNGEKTFRGNKHLGPMIIEACWIAIYKDIGLGACYAYHKQRMNPQKAIVRVARRMSNIIYSVLKNDKAYEPYQWDK
jgi:transposase